VFVGARTKNIVLINRICTYFNCLMIAIIVIVSTLIHHNKIRIRRFVRNPRGSNGGSQDVFKKTSRVVRQCFIGVVEIRGELELDKYNKESFRCRS
jgi:hypothetical protein